MTQQNSATGGGKASDVTGGYETLKQFFPIVNVVMFILGWFTVPIEVLFRKDFGQRWLTVINFWAGFFVLSFFSAWQSVSGALSNSFSSNSYNSNPYNTHHVDPSGSFIDHLKDKSMFIILVVYLLIGSYHFFRMWWRNRTNTALHSFVGGTSRLEPVAAYAMKFSNLIAVPILRIYMLFLPRVEKERKISVPPLLNDLSSFTDSIFEPILLFILAFILPGTTRMWLLISAPALAIYANWKHTTMLNKYLDFRDAIVSAENMKEHRSNSGEVSAKNDIINQAAETIKNAPDIGEKVKQQYPDLMSIIDDLNEEQTT